MTEDTDSDNDMEESDKVRVVTYLYLSPQCCCETQQKLKYIGAMLEQRQMEKYFCAKFNLSQRNA